MATVPPRFQLGRMSGGTHSTAGQLAIHKMCIQSSKLTATCWGMFPGGPTKSKSKCKSKCKSLRSACTASNRQLLHQRSKHGFHAASSLPESIGNLHQMIWVTSGDPQTTTVAALPSSSGSSSRDTLILCFGEMLIDFVPTVNGVSLAEAEAFVKAPGGAPANVAVGISRLGGRAAFLGKVGEDEFGHLLADVLQQNGVDTSAVRFDSSARTALAFVTLRADGEREFMFYRNPSADMMLLPTEIDMSMVQQASVVHFGSISLIAEPCRSAHMALLKAAKESGALLSYDPNLRLPLWPSAAAAREAILSIWNEADVIKVSDDELEFLTNGSDPYSDDVARSLWHSGLRLLLVTEGRNGCRFYTREFSGRVDGFAVHAVDTTGAGDAFVAGLLVQLARDDTILQDETKLRDALKFSNGCGAITTTKRGAIPALPSVEDVELLMGGTVVAT